MALDLYNKKRNFKTTPEPRGRVHAAKSRGLSFVIQKHAASHLHYDFRLELDGVLLSWAVPKGPSLDPADKRLAMHVEDHPLEYGTFEGVIPPKQYGSGTVLLWDRGTWTPKEDPVAGYRKGRLKFDLDGEKLKGGWMLVRSHGGKYGGEKSWLLIKENDEHARVGADARIVDTRPESVASQRTLDAIAADPDRVWHSNKSVAQNVRTGAVKRRKPALKLADVAGARKAKDPDWIAPELATLVTEAPGGDDWLHEIKYDGYRMLCHVSRGQCTMYSRNGKDWTAQLPGVAAAVARLPVDTAWIDGEVIAPDAQGRSSFQALQNAFAGVGADQLAYYAFDVPYLDGYDLRDVPLVERKRVLRELVPKATGMVRYSDHVEGDGATFLAEACRLGLEGIMSKRRDAAYRGQRGRDWVKVKCQQRQEMVIGGWTDPQGSRTGFGALLLGVHDAQGRLRYAGKVGTGFNEKMLASLFKALKARASDAAPFVDPPTGAEGRRAHWVKPDLVAEVTFTEWTRDNTLRHPSFQGLRTDKSARDVVRERPDEAPVQTEAPAGASADDGNGSSRGRRGTAAKSTKGAKGTAAAKPAASKATRTKAAASTQPAKATASTKAAAAPAAAKATKTAAEPAAAKATASTKAAAAAAPAKPKTSARRAAPAAPGPDVVAGVALSNPDKVLYREDGITKRELAEYYGVIGELMVPYVERRPLTLVRCPNGYHAHCFYQKHVKDSLGPFLEPIDIRESAGTSTYMMANSVGAIVALVQMGVLEIHPWGSREGALDRPDVIVMDFDPDEALPWSSLVDAVTVLRKLLDTLGLTGYLRTTGGKGLHVVLPIEPAHDWDTVKAFTKAIADLMVATFPDRFTSKLEKRVRTGKIFVDYLRNAEGATAIATYSVRAKRNAPVAMPIAWSELATDVRFDHFNVRNAPARLSGRRKDPWRGFFDARQSITDAMLERLGVRRR